MRGFLREERLLSETIYLLYCGRDVNFCSDRSAILERHRNRMVLKGVREGSEYIIHYKYHEDWKARQDSQKLTIVPVEVCGLEFMQVKAMNSRDISFRFGKLNYFVR
jgi:hypothetical protein